MGCFVCLYFCVPLTCLVPGRPEEDDRSSRTGIKDGCELPSGFWELNLGPLEEQHRGPPEDGQGLEICFAVDPRAISPSPFIYFGRMSLVVELFEAVVSQESFICLSVLPKAPPCS